MADVVVPRSYIEGFVQQIHDLDGISQDMLGDMLANMDLSDRKAVVAVMQAVCQSSGGAANELARSFYRGLSVMETGKDMTARAEYDYDPVATEVAVSAILRDSDDPAKALADRLSYEVNRAAKVGVWRHGKVDGRQVRFARVPTGAETCAWCFMTAGLGFWFMTEESASHTHRGCDCAIVASIVDKPGTGDYRDVRIDGYDSSVYRDMWRRANALRANGDLPSEMAAHIEGMAALRRSQGRSYREDTNGTLYVMRHLYGLK